MRAVMGRPATLRLHLVDDAGAPLTVDPATNVLVTVTAGDGVTVPYTAQVATQVASTEVYKWTLPAQEQLDRLTVEWSATVAGATLEWVVVVDVIAERLIELWQLRKDPAIAALDPETFGMLVDGAEELIRDVAGFPPVLEGVRVTFDTARGTLNDPIYAVGTVTGLPFGSGGGKLLVPGVKYPAKVYAGSVNGQAWAAVGDLDHLTTELGCIAWTDYRPWLGGRYQLWLTHGDPNPPREVRQLVPKLVKHASRASDYPDRAYQVMTEGATIIFGTTGPDRPTGIPDIDAVLVRYRGANVI